MKILTLSTFPVSNPRAGGEHRVHNVVEFYKSLGHEVYAAGVLGGEHYPQTRGFVPFPPRDELATFIKNLFLMEDWAIGQLFAKSDKYFELLKDCIPFVPDLIHVEHPWLFAFARRYAESVNGKRPFLLYGSANVEHQLKHSLIVGHLSKSEAGDYRDLVLECEVEAIKSADGLCCVSMHDLEWTSQFSRSSGVIAANGVKARESTAGGIAKANKISGHRKFALYCASGHPPNVTGFYDVFGAGIGSIAPDEAIVIAGSAGKSIVSDPRATKVSCLHSRVIDAGSVDEECLQGLLDLAHTIILPITSGGGTNLKTAEALWAKKSIVATSKAMRGFEIYSAQSGVSVQDDPPAFQRALLASMNAEPVTLTTSESSSREQVLWSSTLAPLGEILKRHASNI